VIIRASGYTIIYCLHYKVCLITVKYVKTLYIYQNSIIMLQFYFLEMSNAFCCVLCEGTVFCNLCYHYLAVYLLIAVYQLCNSFKVNTMYLDDYGHWLESDMQEIKKKKLKNWRDTLVAHSRVWCVKKVLTTSDFDSHLPRLNLCVRLLDEVTEKRAVKRIKTFRDY
jgi:hypothetical protein